jgi:hypothetical protein
VRARIGIALGAHWGSIAQALDVIALIGALGAIGTLPALLDALTKYARLAMGWMRDLNWLPVRHP